jgi:hypothetical protein
MEESTTSIEGDAATPVVTVGDGEPPPVGRGEEPAEEIGPPTMVTLAVPGQEETLKVSRIFFVS